MTQRLPSLLSTDDLPLAELCAARLEGELFPVDRTFSPIDLPDTTLRRAESLSLGLNERLIAEQHTAAWIWGALASPPNPHEFCTALDARIAHRAARWMSVREVVIDAGDVTTHGALRVTTPLRTSVDLARFSARFGELEVHAVHALMALGGFGVADCLAVLGRRRNLPGKHLAADRLARVDAVHVIDRINATYSVENAVKVGRVTHLEDVATQRESLARG